MNKHRLGLIALLLLLAVPARAETLDDDTIREVYAQIKDAIRDPVKTREILQARLDDKYTLKTDLVRHIDNQQQNFSVTADKAKTIQDAVDSIARMKMDKYDSNIESIAYSGDHQFAYVKLVSTSNGILSVPVKDSAKMENFAYDITEICTHIVGLAADEVKIMRAECNDNVTLKKQ